MSYITGSLLYFESPGAGAGHSGSYNIPANAKTVIGYLHGNRSSATNTNCTLNSVLGGLLSELPDAGKNRIIVKWDNPSTGVQPYDFSWLGGDAGCEGYFIAFDSDPTDSTYGDLLQEGGTNDTGADAAAQLTPSAAITIGDTLVGFAVGTGVTVYGAGDDTLISANQSDQVDANSCVIYQEITDTADILRFKVNIYHFIQAFITVVKAPTGGGGGAVLIAQNKSIARNVFSRINGRVN